MWQVLLAAAAAAGSGILAKKLINPTETQKPISDFITNIPENDQNSSLHHKDSIFDHNEAFEEGNSEENEVGLSCDGEIFRFSSHERVSKGSVKKNWGGFRNMKKNRGAKCKKKSGEKVGNGSGKKVSVCLKKRRIGKNSAGKCESCASKDSSFGWGVGLGIMYMMSAGKAEMSKLNCTVDETAKIVQELKAEISRRKSSSNDHISVVQDQLEAINKHFEESHRSSSSPRPSNDQVISCVPSSSGNCEYASSVVTMEEQQPEVLEMDQLEAELESELQKLPLFATEGSGSQGRIDMHVAEVSGMERGVEDCHNSDMYQFNGVLPSELDNKLCHVLIGQQEIQIEELESELHHANSKLNEKEAELRALKDCVKRLTQFSLASASDEDMEDPRDDLQTRDGIESTKSTVGMKRSMRHDSYICSAN